MSPFTHLGRRRGRGVGHPVLVAKSRVRSRTGEHYAVERGLWSLKHIILGVTGKKSCGGNWLVVTKPFEEVHKIRHNPDLLANFKFLKSSHHVQHTVNRCNRPKMYRVKCIRADLAVKSSKQRKAPASGYSKS